MKILILTCPERIEMAKSLQAKIKGSELNIDTYKSAFKNFQRQMFLAGESDLLYLEDDIEICNNFLQKVEYAKSQYPNEVIQFFSMRKKDIEVGTRYENGSTYMMMQCTYFPKGIAKEIYQFSKTYSDPKHTVEPNDPCVAEYFKKNKMKYVIWVPNLVDHKEVVSIVDRRRSSKRQSKTFVK